MSITIFCKPARSSATKCDNPIAVFTLAPILEIIDRPGCVSKGTPALITSLAVDPQL